MSPPPQNSTTLTPTPKVYEYTRTTSRVLGKGMGLFYTIHILCVISHLIPSFRAKKSYVIVLCTGDGTKE
jgi:hypothetical protein